MQIKRNLEQFMLAFDTNLAPIVGQQVTLTAANPQVAAARIDLLMSRANAGECDLVAKGRIANDEVGFLYLGGGRFQGDRQATPAILDRDLRRLVTASDAGLTYTCVPLGSGRRIGIDRDLDGALDGDERAPAATRRIPAARPRLGWSAKIVSRIRREPHRSSCKQRASLSGESVTSQSRSNNG